MIEIEPEYNVRQFITIHLNYHIFIFFAVVCRLTISIFLPANTYSIIIHMYICM